MTDRRGYLEPSYSLNAKVIFKVGLNSRPGSPLQGCFKVNLCNFTLLQSTATPIPLPPSGLTQILTGFLESSSSRMLRFSKGMIPRGSLSYRRIEEGLQGSFANPSSITFLAGGTPVLNLFPPSSSSAGPRPNALKQERGIVGMTHRESL